MQHVSRQMSRLRCTLRVAFFCIFLLCTAASLFCSTFLMDDDTFSPIDSVSSPMEIITLPTSCPLPRRSFEPLGTFPFWGRMMNASWPCPTSGMNNQLMFIMGKLHCFAENETRQRRSPAPSVAQFLWKDISCSPTGGREGRRHYAVGGADYGYSWFRWSELLEFSDFVVRPGSAAAGRLVARVCLADTHRWSAQPWLARCPTSVDGIWGTEAYWTLRRALRTHPWFEQAATDFLKRCNIARVPGTRGSHAAVAVHVRRGDYRKFCHENSRGRGRHKYRVAPFVTLKHQRHPNATIRSANFWGACYPSIRDIVTAIAETVVAQRHIRDVLLVTNAASFRRGLADALRARDDTRHLAVHSFIAADEEHGEGEVPPPYWPRRSGAAQFFTAAEAAWMDMNILSMAHVMLLNRYSTFSHSALDLHIVREGNLIGQLQWW